MHLYETHLTVKFKTPLCDQPLHMNKFLYIFVLLLCVSPSGICSWNVLNYIGGSGGWTPLSKFKKKWTNTIIPYPSTITVPLLKKLNSSLRLLHFFSGMNFTRQHFGIYDILLVSTITNNTTLKIGKAAYFSKMVSYSMSNTENKIKPKKIRA